MKIKSREEYERAISRIEMLAKSPDARWDAELQELRDAAQAWDAGQGGEVAGDDRASRYKRPHNPITAMFDRLNEVDKKR